MGEGMKQEQLKEAKTNNEFNSTDVEEVRFSYENQQEDLMQAIEAVDIKNKESTRKTIHIMATVLVGYWAIESIIDEPQFLLSWLMLALAIGLGIYVVREPRAGNLKFTSRFVSRAPHGEGTVNKEGIILEDGTGRDPFLFSDGIKVYRYKKVLVITGKKRRLAMLPIYQFEEKEQDKILCLLEKGCGIEIVEEKQQQKRSFLKK